MTFSYDFVQKTEKNAQRKKNNNAPHSALLTAGVTAGLLQVSLGGCPTAPGSVACTDPSRVSPLPAYTLQGALLPSELR